MTKVGLIQVGFGRCVSCREARCKKLSEDITLNELSSSSCVNERPDIKDVLKVNVHVKQCSVLALRAEVRNISYSVNSISLIGLTRWKLFKHYFT